MDRGLKGWIEAKRLGDGVPVVGRLELHAKLVSRKGKINKVRKGLSDYIHLRHFPGTLCQGPILYVSFFHFD